MEVSEISSLGTKGLGGSGEVGLGEAGEGMGLEAAWVRPCSAAWRGGHNSLFIFCSKSLHWSSSRYMLVLLERREPGT